MFASFKNRFASVIGSDLPLPPEHISRGSTRSNDRSSLEDKFRYGRPPFLQLLTKDELNASADHKVRPIIVPRDISLLPWGTGYAECVNSGKSKWNEDQAAFCRQILSDPTHNHPGLPYTYFGIFDGHAGYGAALAASNHFHHILHEKLVDCIDLLLPRDEETPPKKPQFPHPRDYNRHVTVDELIIGALESAFIDMDELIAKDSNRYQEAGGCTACVSLFIKGKMYVANAGDSRAVLCQRRSGSSKAAEDADKLKNSKEIVQQDGSEEAYAVPFSFDHTPETERERLLGIAVWDPYLLHDRYVAMEYAKKPTTRNLGQRILCRQGTLKGWMYKFLTPADLRMPVVTGEGKRSRLLGTLGVTRGFGDHNLSAINTGVRIKPFLTPQPEVISRDLSKIVSIPGENNEDGDYGILIMGTDGLWDVSENDTVARTVFKILTKYPTEKHRYTMVAQELVAKARGKVNDNGHWRLTESESAATVDDISVIAIPVYQYYKEHVEWEKKCAREYQEKLEREAQQATEATEEVTTLVNGVVKDKIELDEDDEEEIIVEVNKNQEQARVEEEVTSDTTELGGDAQITAVAAALESTELTANQIKDTPKSSPDETNKSKQLQQKHNRNRKDKR